MLGHEALAAELTEVCFRLLLWRRRDLHDGGLLLLILNLLLLLMRNLHCLLLNDLLLNLDI